MANIGVVVGFLGALTWATLGPAVGAPFPTGGAWRGNDSWASQGPRICSASATVGGGTSLTLSKDDQSTWVLTMSNSKWALPVGQHYRLHLTFDDGSSSEIDGAAVSQFDLSAELSADPALLDRIRTAHLVQVNSGTFKKVYSLEGSAMAISAIEHCTQVHLASEAEWRKQALDFGRGMLATIELISVAKQGLGLIASLPVPILLAADGATTVRIGSVVTSSPQGRESSDPTAVAGGDDGDVVAPVAQSNLAPADEAGTNGAQSPEIEVKMKELGGTFVVPVLINGVITLDFVVDSGAADVMIPADVASTLIRAGTVLDGEVGDKNTYSMADGSTGTYLTFQIRTLQLGGLELNNVRAGISPPQGSLLLGQSFLSRFKSWSMDYSRHTLVLLPQ